MSVSCIYKETIFQRFFLLFECRTFCLFNFSRNSSNCFELVFFSIDIVFHWETKNKWLFLNVLKFFFFWTNYIKSNKSKSKSSSLHRYSLFYLRNCYCTFLLVKHPAHRRFGEWCFTKFFFVSSWWQYIENKTKNLWCIRE